MKSLICIAQGLTDVPLDDLNGRTPLQLAQTAAMDALAEKYGVTAVHPPVAEGYETALAALLGEEHVELAVPRAVVELQSLGLTLAPDQWAVSLQVVSAGQEVIVNASDALLNDQEGKKVCQHLNRAIGGEGVTIFHLRGPFAVAIVEGVPPFTRSPSRRPYALEGKNWVELMEAQQFDQPFIDLLRCGGAALADHEINQLREELEEPPINGFLLSDYGTAHDALRGQLSSVRVVTSRAPTVGLAKGLGCQLMDTNDFHAGNLSEWFEDVDTLVVEMPNMWEATYRGQLLDKIKRIEVFDRTFVAAAATYCAEKNIAGVVLPLCHMDIRYGTLIQGAVPMLQLGMCSTKGEIFNESSTATAHTSIPIADVRRTIAATQSAPCKK